MKHIFSFAIIATILALTFTSCIIHIKPAKYNSKLIEKTYNLKDFNAINIGSFADVIYVPGDHYSVKVKTTQTEMDNLILSVKDSVLTITSKDGDFPDIEDSDEMNDDNPKITHFTTGRIEVQPITIYITCPTLRNIDLAGSGSFTCSDSLTMDNLELKITGSGNINLYKTFAKTLKASIIGSGDVKIDWLSANETSYNIIGSGSINSKEFHTKKSQLDISGSGDISVDYIKCSHADVLISGSGDVFLSGHLETLNKNVSGSGDVHTENLKTTQAIEGNDEEE